MEYATIEIIRNEKLIGIIIFDKKYEDEFNKLSWSIDGDGYAITNIDRKIFKMHKMIVEYNFVDHINRNRLDNRATNLRDSTNTKNQWNTGKQKRNTSGFKGVTYHSRDSVYTARISVSGKRINLGYFKTAIEAAKAYDKASKKYHGEYAYINLM